MRWTDLDVPFERGNHVGIACRGIAPEEQMKASFNWDQQLQHAGHVFTFFALFGAKAKSESKEKHRPAHVMPETWQGLCIITSLDCLKPDRCNYGDTRRCNKAAFHAAGDT